MIKGFPVWEKLLSRFFLGIKRGKDTLNLYIKERLRLFCFSCTAVISMVDYYDGLERYMIRFVHGILRNAEEGLVTVEASGIGYGIRVPQSVLPELPSIGEDICLYTYFSVRQDAMELFGFLAPEDREMFVQLLTVSGVGPKGALGILSVLNPDQLRLAIVSGDSKSIQAAPGIGKRTAERVILDLKDKMDAQAIFSGVLEKGESSSSSAAGELHSAAQEAVEALTALGYSTTEARNAVRKVEITDHMTADDVLKQSLRHLAF